MPIAAPAPKNRVILTVDEKTLAKATKNAAARKQTVAQYMLWVCQGSLKTRP